MGAMSFVRTGDPDQTRATSEGACFLYVLPCAYEDLLKLGFSRQPLRRMQELQTRYFEFFDLERAFLVETETVRDARKLELDLGRAIAAHGAPAPLLVRDEAAGHTEWYRGAYDVLAHEIARLGERGHRVHHPLTPWLRRQLLQHREQLFGWATTILDSLQGQPEWLDDPTQAALRRHVLDTLDAYVAFEIPTVQVLPEALANWHAATRARA